MSGVYVPGAFSKKKVTVEIPEVDTLVEKKVEQEPQKYQESKPEPEQKPEKVKSAPKPSKEVISEIKPVEVKQSAWGCGKKSFVECLKNVSAEPHVKDEPVVIKKNSLPIVYTQKEIKKEELDAFMEKYDGKLRKLYEKSLYYEKEYFSKLRINGDQGYLTFCKFMFSVV
jgi:hypothetical protein